MEKVLINPNKESIIFRQNKDNIYEFKGEQIYEIRKTRINIFNGDILPRIVIDKIEEYIITLQKNLDLNELTIDDNFKNLIISKDKTYIIYRDSDNKLYKFNNQQLYHIMKTKVNIYNKKKLPEGFLYKLSIYISIICKYINITPIKYNFNHILYNYIFYYRSGIIPYFIDNNNTKSFILGIDNKYMEYTDFGGGKKLNENVIQTALRELNEECLGIFNQQINIQNSIVVEQQGLFIFFVKITGNFIEYNNNFESRKKYFKNREIYKLSLLSFDDLVSLSNNHTVNNIPLYPNIKSLLQLYINI